VRRGRDLGLLEEFVTLVARCQVGGNINSLSLLSSQHHDADSSIPHSPLSFSILRSSTRSDTGRRSAASAGALEFMTIYSTSNLPKLLNSAREDGWRVLGAAADVPDGAGAVRGGIGGRGDDEDDENDEDDDVVDDNEWDLDGSVDDYAGVDVAGAVAHDTQPERQRLRPRCFDLNEVKVGSPTIIVLGSEGERGEKGWTDTVHDLLFVLHHYHSFDAIPP
jgi:hypothetical protein